MCVYINRLVMAEPPKVAEEALKKIKAQLECSICLDTYTNPKLLPCFHTFCKKCLERLVVKDHDGHTLCCPNCRRTTLLPPAGVSGLQTAFHIDHLFEIHAALTKAKEPQKTRCEKCKKSTATGFCRDCGKFVCDKCTELHQIWKEFANHQIASLSDIQQEAANLVPPTKKVMYCPRHPEKVLEIFCETCGELICSNCTIRLHQGHNYDVVTDTFQKHKEEIVSSLQPVKQQLATVNKAVQALDTRTKEIEDQRMTVETDIHKQIDHLHQTLEQRRTELVGQLYQLTQQKLKGLAAQRDQCELVQTQLSSCLDYMEGSLKTGNKGEILTMKAPVLKQIKQITAEFKPNTLAPQQEADIQLLTDDTLDLQVAEVVTGRSVCCIKSFATGDGLKTATVGEAATVTLHARDKDDRECDALLQDVSGSLVCTRDSTTVKCDVKREGKSTHTVSYRPTTRGRHKLYLKINGKIVKHSPHTVIVRQHFQHLGIPVKVIPGLTKPWGVTTDSKGRIVVTESSGHCVSIFSPEWNKIQSLGSGSRSSREGQFNCPTGVTVDDDDNIYIVDSNNHRIQKFSSDGRFGASVGTRGSNSLQFNHPLGIGFNKKNGKLYVCDQDNHRIQILGTDLTHHSSIGSRGNGNGQFSYPRYFAFDGSGNLYVMENSNHRIQVFTPEGQYLKMFGSKGYSPGKLYCPEGVAILDDRVYVTEIVNHRVSVFSTEGKFVKSFGFKGVKEAQFQCPCSFHVSKDGFILIADRDNNRIQVF